jgi:hypothetical protein
MAEAAANPQAWVRNVTADAIRHFAWGVGDNNPLWLDIAHAQNSRWASIIAPPCFAYAAHETTVAPGFDDRQRIYTSVKWEWFEVISLGAQLFPAAQLLDTQATTRDTTQTGCVEFFDGAGALIAKATTTCRRPLESLDLRDRADRRYTDAELTAIEQAILAETRRGANTRYWEDTVVGESLGTLNKGPLSIMDIVAWCAGALGVPGPSDPVSAGGLLDEVATGPQQTAWLAHLITDWAGDDGFLHRLNVTFNGQASLGCTTFLNGTVTHRAAHDGHCVVGLQLTATTQDNEMLAEGTAVVVQPSKDHGPVALPITTLIELDT